MIIWELIPHSSYLSSSLVTHHSHQDKIQKNLANPSEQQPVPPSATAFSHSCPSYRVSSSSMHLPLRSSIFPTSLSHVALKAAMCDTVYNFAQISLLASADCDESLVWFRASGFYYTTNTRPSPKLLRYPAVAQSHGDSAEPELSPFHIPAAHR